MGSQMTLIKSWKHHLKLENKTVSQDQDELNIIMLKNIVYKRFINI